MTERVVVDNDIVIKVSAYDLARETLLSTTVDGIPPAMLGVGRFVVRDRLSRSTWVVDRPRAEAAFSVFLAGVVLLEPSERELSTAAELERAAMRLNLELDGGESQLLAVTILRGCCLLLTGDKRAVCAIARVAAEEAKGRVGTLEQLIADFILRMDPFELRRRVCAEPYADKTLQICFGCGRPTQPPPSDMIAGLLSYLDNLRKNAPDILLASDDLSALAT